MTGQVKLGFAPTRRNVFDKVEAKRIKDAIEGKLREWGVEYIGLDFLNAEGLLFDLADARTVAERFLKEKVDAVFVPHCNFGTEDATAEVCRLVGKPVLLWGPRDEAPGPDGWRKRDTQCGLFATSKALRRLGVTFTYLPNSWLEGPELRAGLDAFLRVVAAQKALLGARIGQVCTRPKLFWSVMYNEGELLERFGVQVVPAAMTELERGVKELLRQDGDELRALAADMKSRVQFPKQDDETVKRHAALVLWLRKWAERERLSGVALQCWSELQKVLALWPCFAMGELAGSGLPAGCETDVMAALTGVFMQAAARRPTFCADLTVRHPTNDNAELLWHCGPFPSCLAREGQKLEVIGYDTENKVSGLGQWEIRGGPITIGRIDGDHGQYSMFIGQARSTSGPYTRGTYLWIETSDWPAWEEKFIYGPYIHHVTGVHGHIGPILYEACRYVPGLRADPIESEETLRAFWRNPAQSFGTKSS